MTLDDDLCNCAQFNVFNQHSTEDQAANRCSLCNLPLRKIPKHPKPPRCKRPDETTEDYRVAMGWDRPATGQAQADYKSMFGAAVASLAEISEALGIDEEAAACANGNELILAAIAMKDLALKSRPKDAQAEPQWGPILDALDAWSNDCRDEQFQHLDRLIRTEHERTLERIDAVRPTYYVQHPDGSHSIADPQPISWSAAEKLLKVPK